jgi:hypothetical protein
MSSNWDSWSMHVLKSIERVENAIKAIDDTIDEIVEKFNEKLMTLEQRLNVKIDDIEKEEQKNKITIATERVKIGFIISGISAVVSLIVAVMSKWINLSKIFS